MPERDWLPGGRRPPSPGSRDLKQLKERLQPERAGPDRVLVKMRFEEPLRRVDVLASANEAESARPAIRQEQVYSVDHSEHRVRERRLVRIFELLAAVSLRQPPVDKAAPRAARLADPELRA